MERKTNKLRWLADIITHSVRCHWAAKKILRGASNICIIFVQAKELRLLSSLLCGHTCNLNGSEYMEKTIIIVWYPLVKIWQFLQVWFRYWHNCTLANRTDYPVARQNVSLLAIVMWSEFARPANQHQEKKPTNLCATRKFLQDVCHIWESYNLVILTIE